MARPKNQTAVMDKDENRQLVLEVLRNTGRWPEASRAVGYKHPASLKRYLEREENLDFFRQCQLAISYYEKRESLIQTASDAMTLIQEKIRDKNITDAVLRDFALYTPNKSHFCVKIPKAVNAVELYEKALTQALYAHVEGLIPLPLSDLLKVGESLLKIAPTGFILLQFFSQFLVLFDQEQVSLDESTKHAVAGLLEKFKAQKLDEMLSRAHTLKDGIETAEVLNGDE